MVTYQRDYFLNNSVSLTRFPGGFHNRPKIKIGCCRRPIILEYLLYRFSLSLAAPARVERAANGLGIAMLV
jgi:hypothetical protein